jgi:hypothetical protein
MKYLIVFFVFSFGLVNAQDRTEQANAIKNHILNNDYPEVFDDKTYRVAIENVIFDDIDGDGQMEAIVHYKPHFRQSPTIVFYRFVGNTKIERASEALAPGALVTPGDYYLDSHSLGHGIDFAVSEKEKPDAPRKIVEAAVNNASFGNLVLYPNFIHADGRRSSGVPTFIDLSYLKSIDSLNNCESFEFQDLKQIASGKIDGEKYLATWVGEEIYVYKIHSFSKAGFLTKDLWIIAAPKDMKQLNQGSPLSYTDINGQEVAFNKMSDKALQGHKPQ